MVLIAKQFVIRLRSATPVMSEDTLLPFDLPSVVRKKVSVAFDGGLLSSDAGVLLLRGVEKKLGWRRGLRRASGNGASQRPSCTRLRRCFGCGCSRSRRL